MDNEVVFFEESKLNKTKGEAIDMLWRVKNSRNSMLTEEDCSKKKPVVNIRGFQLPLFLNSHGAVKQISDTECQIVGEMIPLL